MDRQKDKNPISKNEELQRTLQTEDGTTLIHMAVASDNLESIKNLLDAGYDINSTNSSGDTALLLAFKSNQFEIVKILLDANANVCLTDPLTQKTILGLLALEQLKSDSEAMHKIKNILPYIMDNLKRSNLQVETLVELFVEAHCPLEWVLLMKDVQVNREFLKCTPFGEYKNGMEFAMEQRDLENVQMILRYGNQSGKIAFYSYLSCIFINKQIELWKVLIESLYDWKLFSKEGLKDFDFMFRVADLEYLKILLDSKIDEQVREKFGIDLRASIFGNFRVDAIELLQKQILNVESHGVRQQTALHFTVKNNILKHTRFLLNMGADINAVNDQGRTALFKCIEWNCIEMGRLLLEHGADVQVIDNNGLTVFEFAKCKKSGLIQFLIAQLAINHVQDVPIKEKIQNHIDSDEIYKKFYEDCCDQLQDFKTCQIIRSITLYDLLIGKIEKLYNSIHNQNIIPLLNHYGDLHLLYYSTLKGKLLKISILHRFKCQLAQIISESTERFVDFDNLVIRKISEYLSQKDVYVFMKGIFMK